MADITAATWDQTDADNDSASPEGAPEGMSPGGLNNTMRMMMGALKRAYVWSNVPTTTTGTSTAYILSYDVAPAALVNGMAHVVTFHATCGASPTLNINSLGAKPLHYFDGSDWVVVPSGTIVEDMVCVASYNSNSGTYRIQSFPSAVGVVTAGADNTFTGENTFSDTLTMSGAAFNEAARVDVASATTTNIGAAASNYVRITGTTTITGLGTVESGTRRHVVFGGALIITHNATSLILPTAANITTVAGDTATFESEASGNWRCLHYTRADGAPLALSAVTTVTNTLSADVLLNNTSNYFTGPTCAQGTSGTWFASGTVTVTDTVQTNAIIDTKLWDGTNVIASCRSQVPSLYGISISLSGCITSPAGNIRISCKGTSATTGKILFNDSGNSKDSTLTVYRLG